MRKKEPAKAIAVHKDILAARPQDAGATKFNSGILCPQWEFFAKFQARRMLPGV